MTEEKKNTNGLLNRRHLRIKVLQSLYAYIQSENTDFVRAQNKMIDSFEKIYDLYVYLLLTFSEVKHIAEYRIDENKKKLRPSHEDLHPNMKFVENQIFSILESNLELRKISEARKINWVGDEHQEMFRKMFLSIRESETYVLYMGDENKGFQTDRNFAIDLFKNEIANNEFLYHFFEDLHIDWLDDIDLVCQMVIKTIKQIEEDGSIDLITLFKPNDDEEWFVKTLFQKTISMYKDNEKIIDDLTKNWELDRIAKMDVLLMQMAITEMQVFNNIPTKVSLNEYIEISKFYSTPKSNMFINGVLDKAIERLIKENKIVKVGRGLMN